MKKTKSTTQKGGGQTGARAALPKKNQAAEPRNAAKTAPALKKAPTGLLKERFGGSGARTVSFYYTNAAAIEVHVTGTFNGWRPGAAPMSPLGDGNWSVDILLDPGSHEYLFLVDGRWEDDPMAAGRVANPFGGMNCVVEVGSGSAVN
jgi:1,4-alpha-glucan branching enzyme